jgi:plastocyanin
MRRVILAAIVVAAAGAFAFNAPAQASNAQVHAASTTFNDGSGCSTGPGETTTIVANESVTWHNCDAFAHTITSDDGDAVTFDQDLSPGPAGTDVTITFHSAGSFPYHCKIHGTNMHGTIVVTEPATSTTQSTTTTTQAVATTTTKLTTTTSSTVRASTTTTQDINGVFGEDTTPTEPTTTLFSTDTTRALGEGGGGGTSAGVIAALILGLGGVGTAAALIIRRMRGGAPPT